MSIHIITFGVISVESKIWLLLRIRVRYFFWNLISVVAVSIFFVGGVESRGRVCPVKVYCLSGFYSAASCSVVFTCFMYVLLPALFVVFFIFSYIYNM
jgi:hypothetical protein